MSTLINKKIALTVFPRVVTAEGTFIISAEGLNHYHFPGGNVSIRFCSKVFSKHSISFKQHLDYTGKINLTLKFPWPGEYFLDFYLDSTEENFIRMPIFAIRKHLAEYYPFKGDFHIHTYHSDGKKSPLHMALTARKIGMDIIAITDHHLHGPSVAARDAVNRLGFNLLVLEGEEVSIDGDGGGHILSINASESVTGIKNQTELYRRECAGIVAEELNGRKLAGGLTAEEYVGAVWTAKTIRNLGGLSILAHPYWVEEETGKFQIDRRILNQLIDDRLVDAVELIGDIYPEDNMLNVAWYFELVSNDRCLPIISNSDTHDDNHTLGQKWTVLFAHKKEQHAVVAAIKNCRSVACEHLSGAPLQIYGQMELVEYAYFLHREFFPTHDDICYREADICWRILSGDESVASILPVMKDEIATFSRRFFGC